MLNEKLVLVTGASRGIGRAIALTLGNAGATVIGTATSDEGASNITKIFVRNVFKLACQTPLLKPRFLI